MFLRFLDSRGPATAHLGSLLVLCFSKHCYSFPPMSILFMKCAQLPHAVVLHMLRSNNKWPAHVLSTLSKDEMHLAVSAP